MEQTLFQFKFFAMGGENELQIGAERTRDAERAAECAIAEVRRIEQKFSRYREDSVLSEINSAAGKISVRVDSETAGLLDYADACYRQSRGMFDITSGVLRRAWNFRDKTLPSSQEIERLLPLIGWNKVSWDKPYLSLPQTGMELDFGGIGKEYAVDRAAAILLERGARSSLVNLSGDIRICGPRAGGIPWSVGVIDPRDGRSVLGVVEARAVAMATSGDYERVIEVDGKRYSHLLNPKTGWPVRGLQSVTVFADSCLIAGSVTTTAMLRGRDGVHYLEELSVPYIAVTADDEIKCAPSLRRFLKLVNKTDKKRKVA